MMHFNHRLVALVLISLVSLGCTDQKSAQERLADAELSFSQGQFQRAVIELKNLLQGAPEDARARLLLGQVYLAAEDADSAVKELERALDFGADRESVLPPLSQALAQIGDFEKLQAIETAGLSSQAEAYILTSKALGLLAREDEERARLYLDTAQEIAPESAHTQIAFAQYHLSKQGPDMVAARVALTKALAIDPENNRAWSMLGQLELDDGQLAKAEEAYTRAVRSWNEDVDSRVQLAIIQTEQKRYPEAEAQIQKIAAIAPKHPGLPFVQGLLALRQGDLGAAQGKLAEATQGPQVYSLAYFYAALTELMLGGSEAAETYLQQFHSASPRNIEGRKLYAMLLMNKGRFAEVEAMVRPILEGAPDDVAALNVLANSMMMQGKTDQGVQLLQRVVELQPDSAAAQVRLGTGLIQSDDSTAGMEHLSRALEINPEYVDADLVRILHYLQQEEFDQALAAAEELLANNPQAPEAHRALGQVYLASGDSARAKEAFLAARARLPGDPLVSNSLAQLAIEQGSYQEARGYYQEALEVHENYLPTLMKMAELKARQGDDAAMRQYLELAMRAHPEEAAPRIPLARYYLSTGQYQEIAVVFSDLPIGARNTPAVLAITAEVALIRNEFQQARADAQRLVSLQPESANAHYLLARAMAGLGESDRLEAELLATLELEPGHLMARVALVRYLLSGARVADAAPHLSVLEEQEAGHPDVLLLGGHMKRMTGDMDGALEKYSLAFKVLPTTTNLMQLVKQEIMMGDRERGISLMEDWIATYPEDIGVSMTLAGVYVQGGQADLAVRHLEHVIASDDRNAAALNELAWILRDSDTVRALGYAERASNLHPDIPEILDTYAVLLAKNSEVAKASRVIARALEKAPDNPSILYHSAMISVLAGDESTAIDKLQRSLSSGEGFGEAVEAQALLDRIQQK